MPDTVILMCQLEVTSGVCRRHLSYPVLPALLRSLLQCAIRAPKHYLYRTLPDAPRMLAWWTATSAAVTAVRAMGRVPRVLLLGAKAGVLAVAALRAGAQHVTCVERCVPAVTCGLLELMLHHMHTRTVVSIHLSFTATAL